MEVSGCATSSEAKFRFASSWVLRDNHDQNARMIWTRICLLTPFKSTASPIIRLLIVACLLCLNTGSHAQVVIAIGKNFTASTFGVDSFAVPPDPNGAVGPLHFAEFINGRFAVYNKSNAAKVANMTDLAFWGQAGISIPSGWDVTDPRIVYDPVSQRWFASEVDFDPSGIINTNRFLLGISTTADPTDAWKGVAIPSDPSGNNFADFPTLGLDSQGVYLSGDMFDPNLNPLGPTLVSIPKAGLLANPPVASGQTGFGLMSYDVRGQILEPVICLDASGQGTVLSVASIGFDTNFVTSTSLITFQIQNITKPGQATLTSATSLTVPPYTAPIDPTQPDLSSNLDDGDARFSAKVYEVGGVLYAVHGTEVNNLAALRWYRIAASSQTVLESGTISDPVMDLFYPSIGANAAGTVVIGYNGSSSKTFVSAFAIVGNTVNGKTTFQSPILLKRGLSSYQNTDANGISRWGDYSATSVDPVDPNRFWTIQEFPSSGTAWSTQVTELMTGFPILSFSASGNNTLLSWSGTLFSLQTTASLVNPSWITVSQNLSTNNGVVTAQVPTTGGQGFFRLQAP